MVLDRVREMSGIGTIEVDPMWDEYIIDICMSLCGCQTCTLLYTTVSLLYSP